MTDIEIIRAMEKMLEVPLHRLEPGDSDEKTKNYRIIKRGYSLDSTGGLWTGKIHPIIFMKFS